MTGSQSSAPTKTAHRKLAGQPAKRAFKAKCPIPSTASTEHNLSKEEVEKKISNFSYDLRLCRTRLNSGDDWQKIIQAHLFFDHILNRILFESFNTPDGVDLDRMAFSAKNDLAYAIGLIPKYYRDILKGINRTRNKIAHDLNFEVDDRESKKIYDLSSKFERTLIDEQHSENPTEGLLFHSLITFLVTFDLLRQSLETQRKKRADAIAHARELLRQTPKPKSRTLVG